MSSGSQAKLGSHAVVQILDQVSDIDVDPRALGLVTAMFPEINAELEAIRMVAYVEQRDMGPINDPILFFQRWLEKAKPSVRPKKRDRSGPQPLTENEIERRVEQRRQLWSRCYGWEGKASEGNLRHQRWLTDAELNEEMDLYRVELRSIGSV